MCHSLTHHQFGELSSLIQGQIVWAKGPNVAYRWNAYYGIIHRQIE